MKSLTLLLAIMGIMVYQASAEKHTITNSGSTFSPNDITINVGDTVIFDLSNSHDAVEVSKATWDANENTKNGGFAVPFGGGTVVFNQAGTFYYVCEPHASFGMKGIIRVNETSGIKNTSAVMEGAVFPNPANYSVAIAYTLKHKSNVNIALVNITGKTLAVIYQGDQDSGNQHLAYNIDQSLPSGVYFIRIMTGDGDLVQKIIIARDN